MAVVTNLVTTLPRREKSTNVEGQQCRTRLDEDRRMGGALRG
jgi:hypothetical protein